MDMSASIILLLFIGSTVQSVTAVDINPDAASQPCLNIYNETQLSLLISSVTESRNAEVLLHSEPVDGRVLPGEEASFLCCILAFGGGWSLPIWTMNPKQSSNLFDFGAFNHVTVNSALMLSLFYMNMRVNGSMDVNGTEITCDISGHTSDPRVLIVLGPPSPPVPLLEFIAYNSLKVNWDPVFTWQDYPIIWYNVTVTNSRRQILINTQTMSNEEIILLDALPNLGLGNCEEIVFTVTATNSLGSSKPGNVSGGFPNALSDFNSTIDVSVLYTSDFEPRVQLTLMLPPLCPYQTLTYTVVLEGRFNNTQQTEVLYIDGEVVLKLDEITVDISPTLGLTLQESYSVYATLYSDGGLTVNTDTYSFKTVVPDCNHGSDKYLYFLLVPLCRLICNRRSNEVILYCLGAISVLLFSTLVVTLCGLCTRWIKKKSFRSSSRSGIASGMITNPIYDSPLYDIIKDERGKLISPSAAASPLSDVFPEFPPEETNDSKLVDIALESPAATVKPALEPRYSSTSENAEFYVKMKGKLNSNGTTTSEPAEDKKINLGQVTLV